MLTLSRLEGFFRVAKTGGYARAAADFSYPISQPGVHQQVRRLEEEIGVTLFERAPDRMVLTAAGQVLHALVARFFADLPGVLEQLRAGTHGGTLRVTSSRLLVRGLLAPRIARFVAEQTDRRVELLDYEGDPLAALRAHDTDLVVEHLPRLPGDLRTLPVATLRACFVVPSAWARGWKTLRPRALARRPFVSYVAGSPEEALQRKALALHELAPVAAVTASSAEALLSLVAAGIGYSVVPAVEKGIADDACLRSFPLTHRAATFAVHACWRPSSAANPLLAAMLQALQP